MMILTSKVAKKYRFLAWHVLNPRSEYSPYLRPLPWIMSPRAFMPCGKLCGEARSSPVTLSRYLAIQQLHGEDRISRLSETQ
jgi:hypothetical protein